MTNNVYILESKTRPLFVCFMKELRTFEGILELELIRSSFLSYYPEKDDANSSVHCELSIVFILPSTHKTFQDISGYSGKKHSQLNTHGQIRTEIEMNRKWSTI